MYHEAMIELFKQIPTTKSKLLSQYTKHKLLLTEIGGSCYEKIIIKKLTQILKHKLSKKGTRERS